MVSVSAPPDVRVVSVEPAVIELAPGGHAKVRATIARENGFKGRVPLAVLNLPFRVTVPDIGLNGILITGDSGHAGVRDRRGRQRRAAEQTLFVTARVETNQVASPEQASVPIRLEDHGEAGHAVEAARRAEALPHMSGQRVHTRSSCTDQYHTRVSPVVRSLSTRVCSAAARYRSPGCAARGRDAEAEPVAGSPPSKRVRHVRPSSDPSVTSPRG